MLRIALAAVLLVAVPAVAHAESVEIDVNAKVISGTKERPSLSVHATEDAMDIVLTLEREDGKKFKHRTGPMAAGSIKKIPLEVPPGREWKFTGSAERRYGKTLETLGLNFVAEIILPVKLVVEEANVDMKAQTLVLTSSRRCQKVDVEVTGDMGQDMGKTTVEFGGAAPGTPLNVKWNQGDGNPMKIVLRVWDTDNFYEGLELFPWHIYIPHEEVNFATGSFKIEKQEEPKLDSSLTEVGNAVTQYGKFADIKLYVVGHTDTVGPSDSNRTLSLNRAKAIAEWFRRHGLRTPLFFDGFGEDALKVQTADETDELANRRVEYIVAIEAPSISANRKAAWKPVR
ncbi:MAG TPA: OmpA family protein [Myxococcales bacterium]|jgi:outer membrane protein OmpA-like peptidoglycan-associated protein